MWMSLARSFTACWSSESTRRMIGASSEDSSRSWGSALISLARAAKSSWASSTMSVIESAPRS